MYKFPKLFLKMDLLRNSKPLVIDYLMAIRPHQGSSQRKATTSPQAKPTHGRQNHDLHY